MNKHSKTDWNKVKGDAEADRPIPYDPETDPYDPNDEHAVEAFWSKAKVIGPGRPRVAVRRQTLNMRVDPDLMEHLRATGKGWQTRVHEVLREAVKRGRL
jgi:uncharacterized protein (DUF4415 family)